MSLWWKAEQSLPPAFSPSFGPSITGGISPVSKWDFTTALVGTLPSWLTYTGATLATMFDSTGKLIYKPINLTTYSDDPSAGGSNWSASGASAPTIVGSTTYSSTPVYAITFPTGASAGNSVANGASSGRWAATSFPALNANINWMMVVTFALSRALTGSEQIEIFVSGNVGPTNVMLIDSSAVNPTTLSQKYLKFNWTGSTGAGTQGFFARVGANSGALGSSVTLYLTKVRVYPVTYQTTPVAENDVATGASPYYGPRTNDYNPATLAPNGALIEEARTNLVFQSGSPSNAAWSKSLFGNWNSCTTSANNTASPDGTTNADLITVGGTGSFGITSNKMNVSASTTYTISMWFKNNSVVKVTDNMQLKVTTLNGGNLVSVAAAGANINLSASGWNRYNVSYTVPASGVDQIALTIALDTSENHTGQSFWAWGGQNELGSFPTSYIPTAASSVTRNADAFTPSVSASWSAIFQRKNESTGVVDRVYYAPGAIPSPLTTGNWYAYGAFYNRALTLAERTPKLVVGASY